MVDRDPKDMTPEERRTELTGILAAGVIRLHEKQNPIFFVVRMQRGEERYCLEHGDFSNRYEKDEKVIYRANIRSHKLTLGDCIASYKAGVRMKPEPKPPVVAPVIRNSVKARRGRNGSV